MALSGTGEKQPDRKWCMQQFRTFNPIADIRHWVREREWQLKTTDRDQEKGTETTEHSMTYLRARGHICTDRSVFARHRHWHCVEWQHMEERQYMEEHNMRQDRQWAQDKGLFTGNHKAWLDRMDGWMVRLTERRWRGSRWPPQRWTEPLRWAWSMTSLPTASHQTSGREQKSGEWQLEQERNRDIVEEKGLESWRIWTIQVVRLVDLNSQISHIGLWHKYQLGEQLILRYVVKY